MRRINLRQQILTQLALLLIALFVILPIWGMGRLAFDASIMGAPTDFRLLPEEFTWEIFRYVWTEPAQSLSLIGLLRNSIIVSGGAALFAVVMGASMAYAFARYRFPGRKTGLFVLLVGAMLPPVALMTPLYILLSMLGLRTQLIGLVIVYAAFSMPFCVWNMRSAFQSVPKELEESAFLDGASPIYTFWRVTLPLALPSIAVAALLAFLIGYTEFAIGWLFVESSSNVTLAMAVSGMLQRSSMAWSSISAMALLMSIPVVIIFLGLNRYLLSGFFLGSAE